jgi:hypothetical protein
MGMAQKTHEQRLASQMDLLGKSTMAGAHLAGIEDQGDVSVMGQEATERVALQRALQSAAAEQLKSQTELQKAGIRGEYGVKAAEIAANPKSMTRLDPTTQSRIFTALANKDVKPEELQRLALTLRTMGHEQDAAQLEAGIPQILKAAEERKATQGPGLFSKIQENWKPAPGNIGEYDLLPLIKRLMGTSSQPNPYEPGPY